MICLICEKFTLSSEHTPPRFFFFKINSAPPKTNTPARRGCRQPKAAAHFCELGGCCKSHLVNAVVASGNSRNCASCIRLAGAFFGCQTDCYGKTFLGSRESVFKPEICVFYSVGRSKTPADSTEDALGEISESFPE